MKKTILFALIAFLLSACQPTAEIPAEVTRVTKETVVVTQIVERIIVVTATPVPATETPMPTPTTEMSPTPHYTKWTGQNVVDAFKTEGLEAENIYPMTKDDYGMAPMTSIEGIYFYIPSLCSDCGGRILVFDNPTDLETSRNYYEELGKQSALYFSWVFVKDNIVLQINGDLPEEQARKYEIALTAMK